MPVNVEMWQPLIQEAFVANNEFLATMTNADEYVVGGGVVHIPQAGAANGAVKNRSVFPAAVTRRVDTDVVYPLDEYTSEPNRISNIDEVELSYDKMESVIRQDTQAIMEMAGNNVLYDISKLCAPAYKIASTGGNTAATVDGATGNRKEFTKADILAARTMLNKQNVPQKDRYMILDEDAIAELQKDPTLSNTFQNVVNLVEGTLPRLYGFQLMSRSSVITVDDSQLIKAPDAAVAATDSSAAIFYQKAAVEKAVGDIKVFERNNDPLYFGDIISFLIRVGSRARRADNKGYGIIYRAAA